MEEFTKLNILSYKPVTTSPGLPYTVKTSWHKEKIASCHPLNALWSQVYSTGPNKNKFRAVIFSHTEANTQISKTPLTTFLRGLQNQNIFWICVNPPSKNVNRQSLLKDPICSTARPHEEIRLPYVQRASVMTLQSWHTLSLHISHSLNTITLPLHLYSSRKTAKENPAQSRAERNVSLCWQVQIRSTKLLLHNNVNH